MKFINVVSNSSGSVGIGTSDPPARLYVTGSFDATQTNVILRGGFSSPLGGAGILDVQNSAGTSLFFVSGSGFIGINTTTPFYQLDVVGQGRFSQALYAGSTGAITYNGGVTNTYNVIGLSGKSLSLGSNLVYDRIFLDTTGNVGIGTTLMDSKLVVNGNSVLSGSLNPAADNNSNYVIGTSTKRWSNIVSTSLSGSLTNLSDGTSYLIAGSGISIVTGSNGSVTINGQSGDITSVTAGNGLLGGGTSGDVTLTINDSIVATISGATFTGPVKFNSGLSGSLTQLTNGTSYLVAGNNVTITSASNGQVTINSSAPAGTISGTGTTNYVSKFTGTSTLGNSSIFDNGTSVGIGTTTPPAAALLTVSGTIVTKYNTGLESYIAAGTYSAGTTGFYPVYATGGTFGSNDTVVKYGAGNNNFVLLHGSNVVMSANVNENVSIGAASYTGRFFVSGSSTASTPTMVVREGAANPSAGLFDAQNYLGTSILFVSGSGRVGVGTNVLSTSNKFEVYQGRIAASGYSSELYVEGSNSGYSMLTAFGSGNYTDLWLRTVSATTDGVWIKATTGRVGIGSSGPSYPLDVNGTISSTSLRAGTSSANALLNSFNGAVGAGFRVIDSTNPKLELWHDGNSVGQFNFSANTLVYGVHNGNGSVTEYFRVLSGGTFVASGSVIPGKDVTYDLGTTAKRWNNLYALNISGSLTGSNVSTGQVVVAGTGGLLSGSNNFWWDNTNGRVGIGASSLNYKFQISSGSGGTPPSSLVGINPVVYVDHGSSPNGSFVIKSHNVGLGNVIGGFRVASSPDNVNYSWAGMNVISDANSAASILTLHTATSNTSAATSAERMRIDVNGNVGIGTNNPISLLNLRGYTGGTVGSAVASFNKTLVIGGTYNQFYNTGSSVLLHILDYSNDAGDNVYPIYVEDENNNVAFFINGGSTGTAGTAYFGGNVGIGAASPDSKFHVVAPSASMRIGYSGISQNYFDANDNIIRNGSGTEAVRITGGNVGIGTTNPAARLHVNNAVQIGDWTQNTTLLRFSRSVATIQADASYRVDPANTPIHSWVEGGYLTGERTGVITAPNSGRGYYEEYFGNSTSTYKSFGFINQTSGSNFNTTHFTSSIALRQDGNVGIGTLSPSIKFHVDNRDATTSSAWIMGSMAATSGYTGLKVVNTNTAGRVLLILGEDNLTSGNTPGGIERHGSTHPTNPNLVNIYSSGPLALLSGPSVVERMRILTGGTVAFTGSVEPGGDLQYDLGSTTKRWKNLYASNISGSLTGSNLTSGQVLVAGTGGLISGSNNLVWFNANSWLGIGTNSPGSQLDIRGSGGYRVQLGYESPAFGVAIQAAASAWARYYSFQDSSNSILGSFGGYGGANTLTYLFIGAAYDNTALRADPSTGNVTIGNASGTGRLYVTGSSTSSTPVAVLRAGVASPTARVLDVRNQGDSSVASIDHLGNIYGVTGSYTGDMIISGDLRVLGTSSIINSEVVNIKDNAILLNAGPSPLSFGGVYVADTTTNTTGSIIWDVSTDRWKAGFVNQEINLVTTGSTDSLYNKTIPITGADLNNISGGTTGGVGYFDGSTNLKSTVAGTSGQILQSAGTSAPTWVNFGSLVSGSNVVTGSGTTNYVSKFISGNAIGNSTIFDNGTNVGINTTSMSLRFEVSGSDARIHDVRVGRGPGSIISNTVVGNGALQSNVSGVSLTAVGQQALYYSTGNSNTAVGQNAAVYLGSGASNTAVGNGALYSSLTPANNTGNNNVAIGAQSFSAMTSGGSNVGIGNQAGYLTTTGNYNFFGGFAAGYNNSTASGNVFLGYQSGLLNTSGSYNVSIGYQAGYSNTTPSSNVAVGIYAGYSNTAQGGLTYVGGESGFYQVGSSNTAVGQISLRGVSGQSNAAANTAIGYGAGYSVTTGGSNFFGGYQAGYSQSTATNNVFLGYRSSYSLTSGSNNVTVGYRAGYQNTTGGTNTFVGLNAGYAHISGDYNTYIGGNTASGATATGNRNVAVGRSAYNQATTGSDNVFLGDNAGYPVTSGSYNVVLGASAATAGWADTNSIAIGYGAVGLGTNTTVIGNSSTAFTSIRYGDVGIGTASAAGQLYVYKTSSSVVNVGTANHTFRVTASDALGGVEIANGANTPLVFRMGSPLPSGNEVGRILPGGTWGFTGSLEPGNDNQYDLGSSNPQKRWRNLYATNISGSLTGSNLTAGQVVVAGTGGVLSGTFGFVWSDSNNRVGIGSSTPQTTLDVGGFLHLGYDSNASNYSGISLHHSNIYPGSQYYSGLYHNNASGQLNLSDQSGAVNIFISNNASYPFRIYSSAWGGSSYTITERLKVNGSNGNVTPGADNAQDLGASNLRWANVYATNISGSLTGSNVSAGQVVVAGTGGVLSGSNNLFWLNTSNRLGIGTSNPTYPLEVNNSGGTDLIKATNSVGSYLLTNYDFYAPSSFRISAGGTGYLNLASGAGSTNCTISLTTNSTTRLLIDSTGNVGIGTGLNLTSRFLVTGSGSGTGSTAHFVNSSGTSLLFVRDDGNVGIGDSNPASGLSLQRGSAGSTVAVLLNAGGFGLRIKPQTGTNFDTFLFTASGESLSFGTSNTERARIDATSGNVGIGTTSTTARLLVSGSSTATTPTMIVREGVVSPLGGALALEVDNSAGTTILAVSGSGHVGINSSSPTRPLTVSYPVANSSTTTPALFIDNPAGGGQTVLTMALNGAEKTRMRTDSSGNFVLSPNGGSFYFGFDGTHAGYLFYNGGSTLQMTIGTGGNVGIGTSGVADKLAVNGTMSVTGSYLHPGVDNNTSLGASNKRWSTIYGTNIYGNILPSSMSPGSVLYINSSGAVAQDNANLFWNDSTKRLGVGTATPGFRLEVNGDFAATTKSFVIPHPLKPGWKLRYGSLEGPENGVYVRGQSESDVINLPDYWVPLVDEESITVQVTPIGKWQSLYVATVENNQIKIGRGWLMRLFRIKPKYFYTVTAARKDSTFQVEYSPLG